MRNTHLALALVGIIGCNGKDEDSSAAASFEPTEGTWNWSGATYVLELRQQVGLEARAQAVARDVPLHGGAVDAVEVLVVRGQPVEERVHAAPAQQPVRAAGGLEDRSADPPGGAPGLGR